MNLYTGAPPTTPSTAAGAAPRSSNDEEHQLSYQSFDDKAHQQQQQHQQQMMMISPIKSNHGLASPPGKEMVSPDKSTASTVDSSFEHEDYQQSLSSGWSFKSHFSSCCHVVLTSTEYRSIAVELVVCVAWTVASNLGLHLYMPLNENRPVPYVITSNSQDVILNQIYANAYVARADQIVTTPMLKVIGMIAPLILMVLGSWCYGMSKQSALASVYDWHSSTCLLLVAIGSNSVFTEFIKRYAGYLRPNFYELCQYDVDLMACTAEDYADGRKSFPSGHSSLSFCAMTCVALYLAGKVQVLASIPTLGKKVSFLLSVGIPLFVAAWVAASRVRDNYHHPADVVGGAVIGMTCAMVTHPLWYPSVFSPVAGTPYYLR